MDICALFVYELMRLGWSFDGACRAFSTVTEKEFSTEDKLDILDEVERINNAFRLADRIAEAARNNH